jgi:hypothetical protein
MSADDLEVAREFLAALALAAQTGDRDSLYPFLASDVEWATPKRDLAEIDAVHEELTIGGTGLESDGRLATFLATRTRSVKCESTEKILTGAFRNGPAWIRTRDQRVMSLPLSREPQRPDETFTCPSYAFALASFARI